ncbi:MAG: site-2 protease family protein [Patescibacteria group bacterium]|nr:site-2 protease family protein [Patescibacteria group bacterium]
MIILLVIISLSILILVHELGHFLTAKFFGVKVEEFGLGFPPRLFSKRVGETTYSVNILPFGGFVKISGEDGDEKPPTEESFVSQPVWRRSAIILAGVFMNVFLGWLILSMVFFVGAPEHLLIADVAPESPALSANLKSGDVILEAEHEGQRLSDPIKSSDLINLVNQSPSGLFLLKVMRGEEIIETSLSGRLTPPEGQGPLGVSLVDVGFTSEPFFRSFIKGFISTFTMLGLITVGFFNFFSKLFVSPEIIETIAGPVGIFALSAQAGSLGLVYLFQLMAFISLNLAILNLIPFPALDGGRFLFLMIEKIKGSPISRRIQLGLNATGFIALIVLMILVTVRDISKLIN